VKAGILLTITTNFLNANVATVLKGFNEGMQISPYM
jgi:hypothetical protein